MPRIARPSIGPLFVTQEVADFIDRAMVLNLQHVGTALRDTEHAPADSLEALAMTLATVLTPAGVEWLSARPYVCYPELAKMELLRRFGPKPDGSWQHALDAFEVYAMQVWGTGG